ncbi:NAD(P)H-dependent flavin oxidoreductase YrpB, nitropropane dioxygenase family [Cetobacterium ceti]|uniref:NAD(P)H-dependent flavin oxidoreductase YrpB, nitropropane dioxygenase family n=1 Tax=Cetobacterium ceti TaxID=180163 RepID=A0A1T4MQJ5_9FUSO|nr:nitronate monooxygenase [Cetobacterium ceti]SJZ69282.1 NAD(P)H-dependent flavin oxidoreductase YrpB, nitropropane dioxygenase family [Cetobacterium ceti]
MIKIGDLEINIPIIQGGMAIRASMSRLAAAVANEGGVGVIAGTTLSIDELKEEIRNARKNIVNKGGALGVNIMVAASGFADLVKTAIEEKVDMLICGAGFSRDVFDMVKGTSTKLVPIVSSLKLAKIAQKLGADAIVVEGGNAGGHLGTDKDSWDIVGEIAHGVSIPVFGAGGVITPDDAQRMLDLGAIGVQMGSRFLASKECEVSDEFKELYVKTKKDDVVTIMSSAGLPANAIRTPFAEKILSQEKLTPKSCHGCLKKCTRSFCVNSALVNGHNGNYESGLFFCGKDIWKIDEILSVKEIFEKFAPIFNK